MNRFASLYISIAFLLSVGMLCDLNAQQITRNPSGGIRATSPTSIVNTQVVTSAKQPRLHSGEPELRVAISPRVPTATVRTPKIVERTQDDGSGSRVGMTYYDFQTNGSMPNRITYKEESGDKFTQLLWMANPDSTRDVATRVPGFNPNRGSRYNYVNVTDPDNLKVGIDSWKKIESERAGWPSAVQFVDGEMGTPSHTPVRFYINDGVGTDFRKSSADPTTAADSALWPRAAMGNDDGQNVVHLIYNRNIPGTPAVDQVMYQRSTTNGDTWEPGVFLTGANTPLGQFFNGQGGDTYAISANGKNVAVVLYSNFGVVLWQSKNNGAPGSWTRRSAFSTLAARLDSVGNPDGSKTVRTDTGMGPLNSMDVIVDAQGVIHWVAAACPQYLITTYAAGSTTPANTIYLMNGTRTDQSDMQYTRLVYGNSTDTTHILFIGPPAGGSWDGEGYMVNQRIYDGASRWPQLGLDNAGSLYCLYGSMKNGDVKTVNVDTTGTYANGEADTLVAVDGLQMHVYGTKMHKPAGGVYVDSLISWSAPVDLSPMGVNSQYATLCDEVVNGRLYYAYSSSPSPGDRVTNVYMPSEVADIYFRALPTTDIPEPIVSVNDEPSLTANVSLAPNPADDASRITIAGVTNGSILVSLSTSMGEIVMQSSTQPFGDRAEVLIPTKGLASGAYMVTIQQNGSRITKTLSVIH